MIYLETDDKVSILEISSIKINMVNNSPKLNIYAGNQQHNITEFSNIYFSYSCDYNKFYCKHNIIQKKK